VRKRGVATPDAGGTADTDEVVRAVIDETLALHRSRGAGRAPKRRACADALVIVDLQNDFCAESGHFARLGLVDPALLAPVADAVQELARAAREAGVPVVFVRTHADPERLPPNVIERHRRQNRLGYLRGGQWGAEFFRVLPESGDSVVTKALYDAFHETDLRARLEALGVRRVVLVGVFADVCVEAAARSAFQHGFEVCVVADGTIALERDTAQALAFMERFYDARVAPAKDVVDAWRSTAARPPRRAAAPRGPVPTG
jgi:nicotinamidase-related amidase